MMLYFVSGIIIFQISKSSFIPKMLPLPQLSEIWEILTIATITTPSPRIVISTWNAELPLLCNPPTIRILKVFEKMLFESMSSTKNWINHVTEITTHRISWIVKLITLWFEFWNIITWKMNKFKIRGCSILRL